MRSLWRLASVGSAAHAPACDPLRQTQPVAIGTACTNATSLPLFFAKLFQHGATLA